MRGEVSSTIDQGTITRLQRMVRRANAFTLAFIRSNDESRQRELAKQFAAGLNEFRIVDIWLDTSILSVLEIVKERVDPLLTPDVLCIFGLDRSLSLGDNSPVLGRLNHDRDLLRQSFPFPVLFWVQEFALDSISRGAPDFWAWRSGVYQFVEQETLRDENLGERFISRDVAFLYSLSLAEKLRQIDHLKRLIEDLSATPISDRQSQLFASLLHQVGVLEKAIGQWGEAREHFEKELKLARQSKGRSNLGEVLLELAHLELGQGKTDGALALFEESRLEFQKEGNQIRVASVIHQLAFMALDSGDIAKAMELSNEALRIRLLIGNKREEAWSGQLMGVIEQRRGDLRRAVQFCHESLATFRKLHDQLGIAGTLDRLGMIEQDRGNYSQAEAQYREALQIFTTMGDSSGIAFSKHQLGTIYLDRGEFDAASVLLQESLVARKNIGDRRGIFLTLAQIGRLKHKKGEFQEALAFYTAALSEMPEWKSENSNKVAQWVADVRQSLEATFESSSGSSDEHQHVSS